MLLLCLFSIGYLMCIFEDKLDETTLEKLQDFEFAVSRWLEKKLVYVGNIYFFVYLITHGCQIKFSDGDGDTKKFFYRTSKTRELDNLLGDIYHKILGM